MSVGGKDGALVATMVAQGLLQAEHLNLAVAEHKRTGQSVEQILLAHNYITEDTLARATAAQLHIPFVDLDRFDVQPQTAHLLTELQARRYHALVLEARSDACLVGVVDPWDLRAQDEIAALVRRPIDLAVITGSKLMLTIDRIYRKTEQIGEFAREVEREVEDQEDIIDLTSMGRALDDADAPVVKMLQTIFDDAARINASDIHFEPQEKSLVVRFRIDGVLHVQVQTDPRIASPLIVRLKLMAALDIAERRMPQDGRMSVKSGESRFDVRMSTMPTQFGESVVLRLLRQTQVHLSLAQIMPPKVCKIFERAIRSPHGMVLVTGPTGSGKTTTLYAALEELNSPDVKILTCEDPVEYRVAGINQVQINEKIELSFARVLRSFLRQDPDVLLVGEIRDSETAEIAARAALTGHMVLSTLHTNSAPATPLRLLDMGVPGYMIASSLLAVLSQRLVRIICAFCSEPAAPPPEDLEWFKQHVSAEEISLASFRRGRGCARCSGVGFSGRKAVFEVLEMNGTLAVALQHANPTEFENLARQQVGANTLERSAFDLVLAGQTTIAEAMTVTMRGDLS